MRLFHVRLNSWNVVLCTAVNNVLYNNKHTEQQCNILGGEVVTIEGNKICRFNTTSCSNDWLQYKNWSTTIPATSAYPTRGYGGEEQFIQALILGQIHQ